MASGFNSVIEAKPLNIFRCGGLIGVVVAESQNGNLYFAHREHVERLAQKRLVRFLLDNVRASQRKGGEFLQMASLFHAIVKVMVAERHVVVADGIHHANNGFPLSEVPEQVVAKRVARMNQ